MITLEEMFNNVGLYDSQTFNLFALNGEKDGEDDLYVGTDEGLRILDFFFPPNGSIRTRCKACGVSTPFSYESSVSSKSFLTNSSHDTYPDFFLGAVVFSAVTKEQKCPYFDVNNVDDCFLPTLTNKYKIYKKARSSFIIHYLFSCKYDSSHIEEMSLLVEIYPPKICITKIGQEPDPSVLMDDLSGKYDSVLSDFGAKADFANAQKSHAAGLSAGSCCYMRRVLEKIVSRYADDRKIDMKGKRISEVIEELSDLGVFVETSKQMLSSLYSVLSVGIHELPDDKINGYYETLSGVVILTLQDELNKRELEKTRKSLGIGLNQIASEISNKKH